MWLSLSASIGPAWQCVDISSVDPSCGNSVALSQKWCQGVFHNLSTWVSLLGVDTQSGWLVGDQLLDLEKK